MNCQGTIPRERAGQIRGTSIRRISRFSMTGLISDRRDEREAGMVLRFLPGTIREVRGSPLNRPWALATGSTGVRHISNSGSAFTRMDTMDGAGFVSGNFFYNCGEMGSIPVSRPL